MTRQGCCVVTTQDADNLLDRLEGLSKVIPPELMEQALLETGRPIPPGFRDKFVLAA